MFILLYVKFDFRQNFLKYMNFGLRCTFVIFEVLYCAGIGEQSEILMYEIAPHIREFASFRRKEHVTKTLSSCYGSLAVLRKLRHLAPFLLRKELAESLVLSKID